MKRTLFWALVAINVILLAALVMPYFQGNAAMAQRAAGAGRRPEIMMIPGQAIGNGSNDVVYLVDTANRQLAAIALNSKGNGLDTLAPEDLERAFNDRGGAVVPAKGGAGANTKNNGRAPQR